MKKLEQLGASPAPWKLDLETCTVKDANGKPVLDNEFGVASMEDADMSLFIASGSLYKCLREAVIDKCRQCVCNRQADFYCSRKDCQYHHWREALTAASGEETL